MSNSFAEALKFDQKLCSTFVRMLSLLIHVGCKSRRHVTDVKRIVQVCSVCKLFDQMLSVQGPHKRPREEGPDSPDDEPQMSKRQVSIVR